jgi:galactokinase
MRTEVVEAFADRFGRSPALIVRAPGRVNLLGGHTDYNDGFVLPVAVDRAAWLATASTGTPQTHIHALNLKKEISFLLDALPQPQHDWADYPRGVAWSLQGDGIELTGMEAVLSSNVPIGGGLSSSAAVEVAFAYAWQQLSGFELNRRDLALACQRAENRYVGVNCGIMDQMASALGVEGHALLLDCRTLEVEPVPLPGGLAVVVADSGVRRELAASEYNVRRAQCEQAVAVLSEHLPGIRALRDVSPAELERLRVYLPEIVYRRARHVITDIQRVLDAAHALRVGDVATLGELMKACHVSLRDDYEVSSPELNRLAEAAWEVAGCYGARLTGAGFGGCIVALVAAEAVPELRDHVSDAYEETFGTRPAVYICHSADGVTAAEP